MQDLDIAAENVTRRWNAVAALASALPITYANNAQISSQNFGSFALIIVVSDFENVPAAAGALTAAEWSRLMTRKSDVRKFVNCGGGVFAWYSSYCAVISRVMQFLTSVSDDHIVFSRSEKYPCLLFAPDQCGG
ncbi:MAG: hypothetical protein WBQ23_13375 [Bacteroidota bacterium]